MKNILELKKNHMVVGRAATAIYLILKSFEQSEVIVPVNICYAAVYPIVFSNNIPKFCDINEQDGNITLGAFENAITEHTKAAIIPHMYGNPVKDIQGIKEVCQDKGILLIEDCASAMGAQLENQYVGTFGDYVIYSTGYSKTIDVGNGGIVCSDDSLEHMIFLYKDLPYYSEKIEMQNDLFSKIYRQIRNSKIEYQCQNIFDVFKLNCQDSFLYQIDKKMEKEIRDSLDTLDSVIKQRRDKQRLFDSLINYSNSYMEKYEYSEGSVPWRFNILVEAEKRDEIVKTLLKNMIPVSDWYPPVSMIFGDYTKYPNAEIMERRILNFPLLIDDKEIERICKCINECTRKENE